MPFLANVATEKLRSLPNVGDSPDVRDTGSVIDDLTSGAAALAKDLWWMPAYPWLDTQGGGLCDRR